MRWVPWTMTLYLLATVGISSWCPRDSGLPQKQADRGKDPVEMLMERVDSILLDYNKRLVKAYPNLYTKR